MFIKKALCTAVLFATSVGAVAGPLTVENGKFMKDGKAFYGVGVNYFDAFTRNAMNGNDKTYEGGLATLESYKIPFIRINTLGFWPRDIRANYYVSADRKAEYHRRLAAFLDAAKNHHIGVILSVFFNTYAFSDMVDKPVPDWGVPGSATRKLMQEITTDLVSKYKGHDAVWAWEFSNEATSVMDLTTAVGQNNYVYLYDRTPGADPDNSGSTFVTWGSRHRTPDDNFTPETITSAIKDFHDTVVAIAPNAVVFSGNNVPRENAYHLKDSRNYVLDTPQQFGEILARNDNGLNTLSMHLYPNQAGMYFGTSSPVGEIIGAAMARSNLATDKRPFYLGEFGSTIEGGATAALTKFNELTQAIIDYKVPMSSMWVFDYSPQNNSYNVTPALRETQLQKLKEMNTAMATWQ